MTKGQAYQIDLDLVHSVIRLTVTAETVTLELAEDIYRHLSEAASSGGPYAAIYDLSAAKHYRGLSMSSYDPMIRESQPSFGDNHD